MMSDIAYVTTNVQSDNSSPYVGTMRVVADTDYGGDWIVVRDYRERTVLGGLAALGGLSSFVGALFLWIFGTDITRALRGMPQFLLQLRIKGCG